MVSRRTLIRFPLTPITVDCMEVEKGHRLNATAYHSSERNGSTRCPVPHMTSRATIWSLLFQSNLLEQRGEPRVAVEDGPAWLHGEKRHEHVSRFDGLFESGERRIALA